MMKCHICADRKEIVLPLIYALEPHFDSQSVSSVIRDDRRSYPCPECTSPLPHDARAYNARKLVSADHRTALFQLCSAVAALITGEKISFERRYLERIARPYFYNGVMFTAADRVLGNIIGSAYTHSFKETELDVIFTRHFQFDSVRRYSAPDQRG